MTRIAIYPGSFDPPTRGHEDLIRRSLLLSDRLIVAWPERLQATVFGSRSGSSCARRSEGPGVVRVVPGLLADFAKRRGQISSAAAGVSDFEYEFQMALMNRQLNRDLETVFLVPDLNLTFVSSSLVREVARFGGDVTPFVHPAVARALARRYAK
jgi:pantetheine-phosphate adenylyltransferase